MKRTVLILIPLLLLSSLIAWRLHQNEAAAASQTEMRAARMKAPPVVSVAVVSVRTLQHTFESVGTVTAPLDVKLAAKVTGRIDSVLAQPGDQVHTGQLLVQIDPSDILAQIQQNRANVAEAQYKLAEAETTKMPAMVSVSSQIAQQKAAVASARANYKQLQENYDQQVAAAESAVTDAQGRVDSATAAIANAKAVIQSARANLENAQSQYKRTHDLFTGGFVAAQDVDTAMTEVKVQQSAVNVARSQLNTATAAHDSAAAQLLAAENQAQITKNKGKSDIAAGGAQLAQAQAALDYANANQMQVPAYTQSLEALKAAVNAAQASLADVEALYAQTRLASPIDGYVTARYMDPGTTTTAGQPILALSYIRQVWVTIPVPEETVTRLSLGQAASVTFDALPGRQFTGTIIQIPPSADPVSRQVAVRIRLDNSAGLLKPGMFARVTIVLQKADDATVVPPEAVHQDKSGSTVLAVDQGGVVHKTPVSTGMATPNDVAIVAGLKAGERVVTLSARPLKDGETVQITGSHASGSGGQGGRRSQAAGSRKPHS
ncbi:MAG TPA: efflux RND transporter periplasmic adaptor subunit [Armatimonadota bacterium]|nr:efflux RND transporter periplasmic adaptor subunit [Armatimonadota bacterium]